MNNKKGQAIRKYVLSLVLFSFFVSGFWAFYGGLAMAYDTPVNETFVEPLSKLNESFALGNEIGGSIDTFEPTETTSEVSFLTSGYNTLLIVWNSLGTVIELIHSLGLYFGIPTMVTNLMLSVVMIFLVFALISVLVNRNV